MAIPAQAIEKLTRSTSQGTRGVYGELLMFAGTLCFVSVAVWVGITFGYNPYLTKEVARLDAEIKQYADRIPLEKQQELISFYSQLANIKKLLSAHVTPSASFDLLERMTHTNVFFTKATINVSTRQISLTGVARGVEDIAEQVALFERAPEIKTVTFRNLGPSGTGTWLFSMDTTLKSTFFTGVVVQQ